MLLAAGIVASVSILAGRSSAPALIFPQQVAIVCGSANGEITILKADGVFTGGAAVTLSDTVQPAIAKVRAVGATVTAPDLQTIVNTTLLAIKALVDASSLQKQGRSGRGDRYGDSRVQRGDFDEPSRRGTAGCRVDAACGARVMKRIRVALSGSGFRLGALQATADAGYTIVERADSSGGSIIASLDASGMPLDVMRQMLMDLDWPRMIDFSLWAVIRHQALCSGDAPLKYLLELTNGRTFAQLDVDLKVITANLLTEREFQFSKESTPEVPVALAARERVDPDRVRAGRRGRRPDG
ncbi:TPA: hypothetical protein ACK3Q6_002774 [Burkholderia cepacia]|uniref:hypothetical protein n=1 Tax=Burkholderia cepacia TaxID=292 RepID=UPI001CF30696|nr:hypothetical protein [Burkholderia cepacia]MCA8361755.1 hypothetical protein [Burkholderia cepacia]